MKSGRRALGFAESYRGTDGATTTEGGGVTSDSDRAPSDADAASSTLAGAVVRADGTVDDFVFGTCTVGGDDVTDALVGAWRRLDRPDVRYLFVSGVALAWYNVLDLEALAASTDRPVLAVTYEASDGLADAITDAFDGRERARRLEAYEALPERRRVTVDGETYFLRCVGLEPSEAERILATYTAGRRPEPLRVAKRAARRVDAFRRSRAFRRD